MATNNEVDDLARMLENSKLDVEDQLQRAVEEETNGRVSSNMNIYHGVLSSSRGQSQDHPQLLMYDHSPGFETYDTGMAKVKGRRPDEEIVPLQAGRKQTYRKDSDVQTDYIPFEVLPEEAMPTKAMYEDENFPEIILEHAEVDMQEGRQVTFQIHPYDPGDITGENWRQNLQNYERGNLSFTRTGS